jgi:hypothetical protein
MEPVTRAFSLWSLMAPMMSTAIVLRMAFLPPDVNTKHPRTGQTPSGRDTPIPLGRYITTSLVLSALVGACTLSFSDTHA